MIEFQDVFEDPHLLEKRIADQIRLIRALANFHIDTDSLIEPSDLVNQRTQIKRQLKELQARFAKLVKAWQEFSADLSAHIAYDPENDQHSDLATKFIKMVVPSEMQSVWHPDTFTGSLLILFENGKIYSSSLIEKRLESPEKDQTRMFTSNNGEKEPNKDDVKVVEDGGPLNSFFVLQSPTDCKLHIYFALNEPATVFVIIYNEFEQVVRQIEKHFDRAGDYTIVWDGLDDEEKVVAKGKYYCQLQVGGNLSELKEIELA